MTLHSGSIPEEPRPGYVWTCGMCGGLRMVPDEGGLIDCPRHALARDYGVVYEMVRRNVTPCAGSGERLASPAVQATKYLYEVWAFWPDEGTARLAAVEHDSGAAFWSKWDLEEEAYGAVGA